MTLEEAIIHCKEKDCDDTQCAREHRQLAEWLEELKQRRAQEQQEVDLDAVVNEAFYKYSSVDGYGQLVTSFNRAELYSFIKTIIEREE